MKKYLLARNISKKYSNLARLQYMKFGCMDRRYLLYVKFIRIANNILNKNGWDNLI
jgi:hypothetical protein